MSAVMTVTDRSKCRVTTQFPSKEVFAGAVGYFFNQITGDSEPGTTLGSFQSRVVGLGSQLGYLVPMGDTKPFVPLQTDKAMSAAPPSAVDGIQVAIKFKGTLDIQWQV